MAEEDKTNIPNNGLVEKDNDTYEVSTADEKVYEADSFDETLTGKDSTELKRPQKSGCTGLMIFLVILFIIFLLIMFWDRIFGAVQ